MSQLIRDRPAPLYEVVVVGAGIAGLAAALEASSVGARTLLIESSDSLGGAARISGGGICVAGTDLQRSRGIDDDAATARPGAAPTWTCGGPRRTCTRPGGRCTTGSPSWESNGWNSSLTRATASHVGTDPPERARRSSTAWWTKSAGPAAKSGGAPRPPASKPLLAGFSGRLGRRHAGPVSGGRRRHRGIGRPSPDRLESLVPRL
ncbi:FAD-binding protein [Micromonospora sp. NPDC005299]|uniref:FAD-binding protein n=1 Tax=Micromonospora sp. NPDC005299 TaxID=3364231 RepID=UPI0036AFC145